MQKSGEGLFGKTVTSKATIVVKHSVHMFMSVTRLHQGHLEWQQEHSVPTCHDSSSSSHMSMYSFATILFTSFSGTEPKPAMHSKSASGGGTPPGGTTAKGHAPYRVMTVDGHDQLFVRSLLLAEASENIRWGPTE